MKNKKNYYLYGLLLLVSIIMFKNRYLYGAFWIISTIIMIIKCGFANDKNYLKGNTIRIVIISLFSYFIITYGLGLVVGFTRTFYNLKFISIIQNIMFPLILIVLQEIQRYIISKKCHKDMKLYIYFTIIYIFLDILMEFSVSVFNTKEFLFLFTCLVVLPTIARQCLYSYITYNVSYVPTLIIRLVFGLYIYILPIFPALGNYINSVLGIVYPLIVYYVISKSIKYYDKSDKYVVSLRRKYVYMPFLCLLLVIFFLVSGIGKYKLIAIGSGSMEPLIYRGDTVLYEKINDISDIKIGTVMAFMKSGVLITHRVVGYSLDDGRYVFKTKGDNNNIVDAFDVYENEVLGVVVYKISYIGYPTIWFNEFLEKIR